MLHALIADAHPGDVLVYTMEDPAPFGVVGELLATQAQARGAAALLIDAAVRDLDELREIGFPIWTRWLRARGAEKQVVGELDVPVVVGGQEIRAGDVVVLDCDGAAVLPEERIDEVLPLALEREAREQALRTRYAAGELSYDVNDLRSLVEGGG
jgi:4-hydroxy-4-methyl-2-oxoglutarate aldolase